MDYILSLYKELLIIIFDKKKYLLMLHDVEMVAWGWNGATRCCCVVSKDVLLTDYVGWFTGGSTIGEAPWSQTTR